MIDDILGPKDWTEWDPNKTKVSPHSKMYTSFTSSLADQNEKLKRKLFD